MPSTLHILSFLLNPFRLVKPPLFYKQPRARQFQSTLRNAKNHITYAKQQDSYTLNNLARRVENPYRNTHFTSAATSPRVQVKDDRNVPRRIGLQALPYRLRLEDDAGNAEMWHDLTCDF
ncbi:hypothetical protein [Corynebacterium auriscanis]|uniref:hypothetical protein n=1 Tax=Corynebacterium auriscanis TaxID=99807 RepID=UPI0012EB7368|nr:hypothetical protein [Corynebacterium auriscanis]WJY72773.1 hypothetical protein CAURIC_05700 [Corynebacterium auriscanis]